MEETLLKNWKLTWGFRLEKQYDMRMYYDNRALLFHYHLYDCNRFVKRAAACAKILNQVKEVNLELYLEITNQCTMQMISKHIYKSLFLDRITARILFRDRNFEKYLTRLEGFLFRLYTINAIIISG